VPIKTLNEVIDNVIDDVLTGADKASATTGTRARFVALPRTKRNQALGAF